MKHEYVVWLTNGKSLTYEWIEGSKCLTAGKIGLEIRRPDGSLAVFVPWPNLVAVFVTLAVADIPA